MKKNYKQVSLIILLIIVLACLQSCSSPDEKNIKPDLQNYFKSSNNFSTYTIDDLTIEKMQKDDSSKTAHFWADLSMSNSNDKFKADIEFVYDYYDKGGWKFRDIENMTNTSHTPLIGCDENTVVSTFEYEHNVSNVKVDSRDTDLDLAVDTFYLTYTVSGANFDCTYSAIVEYDYSAFGEWKFSQESINTDSVDFHPTGIYGYVASSGDYPIYYYLEFTGYNENSFNLARYEYIDMNVNKTSNIGSGKYSACHYTLPITTNENGEFIFTIRYNEIEHSFIIYSDHIDDAGHNVNYVTDCDKTGWKYIQSFDDKMMKNGKYNGVEFDYSDYYARDYQGKKPDNTIKIPNLVGKNVKEAKQYLESLGFNNVEYTENLGDYAIEYISTSTVGTIMYVYEGDYLTPASNISLI